jgi:S-formylglutathione hydrolase
LSQSDLSVVRLWRRTSGGAAETDQALDFLGEPYFRKTNLKEQQMTSRKLSFIFALLCVLSSASSLLAQQAAARATAGRLLEVNIPAPALKGNLLSDPLEQSVVIYLPPGYDAAPAKRFPTLYLLHGFTANQKAWTSGGYQGMSLGPFMDEMIKSGKSREMIVVAPKGRNTYQGSFYTNSIATGNWEDYILRDVVGYIDANYRSIARPESRGIAGHSMGGYGAVVLGMKHPDVFSAIYALSPCCLAMEGDFGSDNPAWQKAIHLKSKDELKARPQSFGDFYVQVFTAMAAAFSPNSERPPLYVNFPYQERDGKLEKNESVYEKWTSKFPVNMVEQNKQNLLKLRGIFIDFGEKEEFSHIRIGGRQFSAALGERSIPHIFEIYASGDHGSKIRQRLETRVLQFFSERLEFGEK